MIRREDSLDYHAGVRPGKVELRATMGSLQNRRLLRDAKEKVDVAFVQGGSSDSMQAPDEKKKQDTRIAQHAGQGNRRHAIGAIVAAAEQAERSPALECEPHGRRHRTGNCRRRADHRIRLPGMRGEM